jgi:hypothetical protein
MAYRKYCSDVHRILGQSGEYGIVPALDSEEDVGRRKI